MKIKMRTVMAGPEGAVAAGAIIDLPPGKARELIAGGFAVPVDPLPQEAPPPDAEEEPAAMTENEPDPATAAGLDESETATAEPGENADNRPTGRGKGGKR